MAYNLKHVSAPVAVAMTQLLLVEIAGSMLLAQSALAEPARDLDAAFDKAVYNRSGGNFTDRMDLWLKKFESGKIAEADKLWASIIKDCAGREEIGDFIEVINMRTWFAEDTSKKQADPEKAYQHLLDITEKMLGKDHRYVADICTYLALYAESRNDFKKAKELRLRDLHLHEKALGESNHQVIEAYQEVGHLLVQMKEYTEAEVYLKTAMRLAQRYK